MGRAHEKLTMETPLHPILFLDLDDVVVLNRPVEFDKSQVHSLDADLCRQLIHPPAGQTLVELQDSAPIRVVITSNWVRFASRAAIERLFQLAGFPQVAQALHPFWCASKKQGATRLQVIDEWLAEHSHGEPYCVIDDADSGASLLGSRHDQTHRLLLCKVGTGLHRGHLPFIRAALSRDATD